MGGTKVGILPYHHRTITTPEHVFFSFTCISDESFFAFVGFVV